MLFNILALIALLLVLALLKRIACILPSVVTCMFRWKENVNIDTSLRLRTERDLASAARLLPFCLPAHPQWVRRLPSMPRTGTGYGW